MGNPHLTMSDLHSPLVRVIRVRSPVGASGAGETPEQSTTRPSKGGDQRQHNHVECRPTRNSEIK